MKMRKALDQPQNEMPPEYIIKHSEEICKSLNQLQFIEILTNVYLEDYKRANSKREPKG